MGFLDYLKKLFGDSQPQAEPHKKGYQPDQYYTEVSHPNTPFERKVITFDERKGISYPSKNGLYVAEILLLEYCSYGTYPLPKNGYPGFWWFEYGIRDIEAALSSLENRGFIRLGTAVESTAGLTVPELKEILKNFGLAVSGKKDDLIDRIQKNVTEDALAPFISERKYVLTNLGVQELTENEYVPYMHKNPNKTIEDGTYGPIFNVWEVNRRISGGDPRHWKTVIHSIEQERNFHDMQRAAEREKFVHSSSLTKEEKALHVKIAAQNDQLAQINAAEELYKEDLPALIAFWEELWGNGGLLFRGSKWHFRLPDLYIKQKRYDDALKILRKLSKTEYKEKAQSYIVRVNELKEKQNQKKKK